MADRPEIVCLCGGTRFEETFHAENRRLTLAGTIVLTVGVFGHDDAETLTEEQKVQLDELHKRKIDLADRVHVLNVDGYVGESTRSEIAYARNREDPVTWLEPEAIPDEAESD